MEWIEKRTYGHAIVPVIKRRALTETGSNALGVYNIPSVPYPFQEFKENQEQLVATELLMMRCLNFDFKIEHAYPYVYDSIGFLGKKG